MVYKLEMNDLGHVFSIGGEPLDSRRVCRHSPDKYYTLPLIFNDLDCAAAVWVNEE